MGVTVGEGEGVAERTPDREEGAFEEVVGLDWRPSKGRLHARAIQTKRAGMSRILNRNLCMIVALYLRLDFKSTGVGGQTLVLIVRGKINPERVIQKVIIFTCSE
ncbi:hypothetical protein SE15_04750 [Thermanaerothrix daxensis]|uniref:Uncharacterized protein n=1 Tax=Thermanaerothrix daxensis TaxID=869279 RepID=A0A0P6XW45_9CHLR|nr:hypothetical protein SE15_04750 [Thermanaerothrix daxensis]